MDKRLSHVFQDLLSNANGEQVLELVAALDPGQAIRLLTSKNNDFDDGDSYFSTLDRVLVQKQVVKDVLNDEMVAVLLGHLDRLSSDAVASLASVCLRTARPAAARAVVESALRRHVPKNADLLRVAIEVEMNAAMPDPHRVHDLLTLLGRADAGPGTVDWVFRQRQKHKCNCPPVRVALLSSFTIDPLVPYLDLEGRALHLDPEIYVAPFNSIGTEILSLESGLHEFDPEVTFLSYAIDDLLPGLAEESPSALLEARGEHVVNEVCSLASTFLTLNQGLLAVHSFVSAFVGKSLVDWRESGAAWALARLNHKLSRSLLDLPRTHVIDTGFIAAGREGGTASDPKMRYLAGFRLSSSLLPALARLYARFLVPTKGINRKCAVLDLDNTLWGGIVGEDGFEGIRLGATSPGVEYVDFQRALKRLNTRGVLLAVNSKNNFEDAMNVIRNHPDMVLREADFAAVRINWESKVHNIQSIADELNIGLNAIVFLDDSPTECERMRQMMPEVETVQLPRDSSQYRVVLEDLPYFEQLDVTSADVSRPAQYRERKARTALRRGAKTLDEYLLSLGIYVSITVDPHEQLARLVQLIHRTNQFNLTTRRHMEARVAEMLGSSEWRVYSLKAEDRFGQHGVVAMAIVQVSSPEWRIDSFLMSCRVIGQGIEHALLARLVRDASAAGCDALLGEYVPTTKNTQVESFYESSGFEVKSTSNSERKFSRMTLPSNRVLWPSWITGETS